MEEGRRRVKKREKRREMKMTRERRSQPATLSPHP
jgi:hypothetical protein